MEKCKVVTIISCTDLKLKNDSCANCGLLEWWFAFKTEDECNNAYRKEYPEQFDENGKEKRINE